MTNTLPGVLASVSRSKQTKLVIHGVLFTLLLLKLMGLFDPKTRVSQCKSVTWAHGAGSLTFGK